jgi:hypothetical protein
VLTDSQVIVFIRACREARIAWTSIAKALNALEVRPQQLHAGRFPSLDDCDTIHSTLVMRFSRRHGLDYDEPPITPSDNCPFCGSDMPGPCCPADIADRMERVNGAR